MSYRLETHLHTIVSSACGRSTPAEEARYYKSLGYDGICITDHFYLGNTCIPRSLPWEEWVNAYASSYRMAKVEGDRIGLDVFFGWESTYRGEDFLIYGLSPEWLIAHPEVLTWNQAEQFENVSLAGGFVVQAHPFRERNYMTEVKLHPHHAHAWEVANACNEPYQNRLAYEEAQEYGIPMFAGSDLHFVGSLVASHPFGLELDRPLTDIRDLKEAVLSGAYRLIDEPLQYETEAFNPYFDVTVFDEHNRRVLRETPYYPGRPKAPSPFEG